MPRPLPRRVSSSLPPPPRRAYTPSLDESEPDDYFQDRGRRSSHTGHGPSDSYDHPRRRAESAHHYQKDHDHDRRGRYRPSSRDSTTHRPRHASSSRYHDPREDEERGRARSRPTQSLDNHRRRRFSSRASSASSSYSSSPSSSRSSSTDSSLSSHHHHHHHHYGGHRQNRRKSSASNHGKRNERYYPPSASRTSRSTAPPKRGPLHRLRSLSLPAVASKLARSGSRSRSSSPSPSKDNKNPLRNLKSHIKSPRDQPPEKRSPREVFFRAAQCAAEAGAIAALKLRDDPSPWIGPNGKAPKVAAAALSAAAVDTFMEQRHPNRKGGIRHTVMRQVTQMAIGNLVKHAPVPGVSETTVSPNTYVRMGAGGGKGRAGGGKGGRVHTGRAAGGGGRRR